jgi:peptidoglycan/LPS O-acetylase OafA/YrhL
MAAGPPTDMEVMSLCLTMPKTATCPAIQGRNVMQDQAGVPAIQPKAHYRPEIDGLRAFAVVPVVLFHLGVAGFHGGSLGVDVFFVISGFLIMSIVRREVANGTFSFKQFWARRIRRILPAMIAVSASSLLFTFLFVYRPDQAAIGRQGAWASLSGANVYFWKYVGSYWGSAANESPFLHMWSLAVEEQFYLFMPLTVWLICKIAPRGLLACVIGVAVTSLAVFIIQSYRYPTAAFYLLPSRAWELAAGCALALVAPAGRGILQSTLSVVGLILLLASYFVVTSFGIGLILPVTGTVLVLAFAREGVAFHVLANRLTVFVGKLSYSLYLWHWPVIVFPMYVGLQLSVWASLGAISVLSILSYYLIEKPARQARYTVPIALIALGLTAAAAVCMARLNRIYDTSGFEVPDVYVRAYDCNPTAPPLDRTWVGMNVPPTLAGSRAFADGGVRVGVGDPQVVLLGDSHGTFWAPVINQCVTRLDVPAALWVMGGVDPFFSVPAIKRAAPWYVSQADVLEYDTARIRLLKQWRPRVVIVAARWSVKSQQSVETFVDHIVGLADHVLLIEQPPELTIGNRNALQYLCFKGYRPEDGIRHYADTANGANVLRGRDVLHKIAASHPNCSVVPIFDLYDKDGQTLALDGRKSVYMDDDHLTYQGASLAQSRIEQAIARILSSR